MAELSDTERLLRYALSPVEPPHGLADRVERHLALVAGAAAEELADWELSAMRDPRNWVRPVAAVAVGSAAAGALVLVRARRQAQEQARGKVWGLRGLDRGTREVVRGLRRRLER
ncbi:MAG TPA: hypothetical protein VGV57_08530 [Thermoleophilaceae bacterium]|nr:hypothetical protein [Thermoleophilaceae bacterium]